MLERKTMYWIFDNEGATLDRYTLITNDGDVYSFNDNPFHPAYGFGQFSHNCNNNNEFEYEDRNQYVADAIIRPEWLGKRIKPKDLPEKARQYVNQMRKHGK